jgi:hypothetical protein
VQWRIVLAACIFIGGLCRPAVAYAAFIAAIAFPLYLISIYLMALALAVLILSAPLVAFVPARADARLRRPTARLPLALLVLVAPLLAPLHLTPVLPLLAGLWWDEGEGAVAGGLAALWLKICAALSGHSTDLWRINDWSVAVEPIYQRFHTANSLQTLIRLSQPLAASMSDPGGTEPGILMLFNLLQVLAWGAAGYVVSVLLRSLHVDRGRGWMAALSLGPGLTLVWAGYVAVPSWLGVEGPTWLDPLWLPAQVVLAGFFAWGLDGLMHYLSQPVVARRRPVRTSASPLSPLPSSSSPSRDRRPTGRRSHRSRQGVRDPLDLLKKATSKGASERKEREEEDIIMIELD